MKAQVLAVCMVVNRKRMAKLQALGLAALRGRLCPIAGGGMWDDSEMSHLVHLLFAGLLAVAESATMARIVFDPADNAVQTVTGLWSTANTGLPWLLVWLYFAGLEASRLQATPGKRLMGLRVTDLSGRPASLIRTTFRNGLKSLSAVFLMLGFVMAGVTARKQALHDVIAGCVVLRK